MPKLKLFFFVLILIGVVLLWKYFPNWLPIVFSNVKNDVTTLGTFGDSFGVLNSLFSALAFCGVSLASYFQYVQIKMLKDKEDSNDRIQKIQLNLMALTAAMSYHNSEADRLQGLMSLVIANGGASTDPGKITSAFIINGHVENNKQREEVMKKISEMMTLIEQLQQ